MARVIIFLIFLVPFIGQAQNQLNASQLALKRLGGGGMYGVYTEVTPGSKVIGSPYLDEEWRPVTIKLYEVDENISMLLIKYNIYSNVIEVKINSEVKGLEGNRVEEFSFLESNGLIKIYRNKAALMISEDRNSGFYEVIADGDAKLLKRTEISIKKPDYSVQFNTGSRDTQVIKKESLWCSIDSVLYEIPASTKKLVKLFGSKGEIVSGYIRSNNKDIRDENDLSRIFLYYNQLVGDSVTPGSNQ